MSLAHDRRILFPFSWPAWKCIKKSFIYKQMTIILCRKLISEVSLQHGLIHLLHLSSFPDSLSHAIHPIGGWYFQSPFLKIMFILLLCETKKMAAPVIRKLQQFIKGMSQKNVQVHYLLIMDAIWTWASVTSSPTWSPASFSWCRARRKPSFSILGDFSPTSRLSITIIAKISLVSWFITV